MIQSLKTLHPKTNRLSLSRNNLSAEPTEQSLPNNSKHTTKKAIPTFVYSGDGFFTPVYFLFELNIVLLESIIVSIRTDFKDMKLKNLLLIAFVFVAFCSCQNYQPTTFTVASYNLRNANGSDSARGNGWGQRYPIIAQMVQYHDFDIFGTQECFPRARQDERTG